MVKTLINLLRDLAGIIVIALNVILVLLMWHFYNKELDKEIEEEKKRDQKN